MSILIAAMLAGAATPDLDKAFLQARVTRALQAEFRVEDRQRDRAAGARKLLMNDLTAISSVCTAANQSRDPRAFLKTLSAAYSMSDAESASLGSKCALFLRGLAEGRRRG